jgi:hypothetical protein
VTQRLETALDMTSPKDFRESMQALIRKLYGEVSAEQFDA